MNQQNQEGLKGEIKIQENTMKGELPMTTKQRCLNKYIFKNLIMDLAQLRSGSSPERSYYYDKLYKTYRTGNQSKIC